MDETVKKAVTAYRACIKLPARVTDEELAAEAAKILKLARQGDPKESVKFAIAQGLANRVRVRFDVRDCSKLAVALIDLAIDHGR